MCMCTSIVTLPFDIPRVCLNRYLTLNKRHVSTSALSNFLKIIIINKCVPRIDVPFSCVEKNHFLEISGHCINRRNHAQYQVLFMFPEMSRLTYLDLAIIHYSQCILKLTIASSIISNIAPLRPLI